MKIPLFHMQAIYFRREGGQNEIRFTTRKKRNWFFKQAAINAVQDNDDDKNKNKNWRWWWETIWCFFSSSSLHFNTVTNTSRLGSIKCLEITKSSLIYAHTIGVRFQTRRAHTFWSLVYSFRLKLQSFCSFGMLGNG